MANALNPFDVDPMLPSLPYDHVRGAFRLRDKEYTMLIRLLPKREQSRVFCRS